MGVSLQEASRTQILPAWRRPPFVDCQRRSIIEWRRRCVISSSLNHCHLRKRVFPPYKECPRAEQRVSHKRSTSTKWRRRRVPSRNTDTPRIERAAERPTPGFLRLIPSLCTRTVIAMKLFMCSETAHTSALCDEGAPRGALCTLLDVFASCAQDLWA